MNIFYVLLMIVRVLYQRIPWKNAEDYRFRKRNYSFFKNPYIRKIFRQKTERRCLEKTAIIRMQLRKHLLIW